LAVKFTAHEPKRNSLERWRLAGGFRFSASDGLAGRRRSQGFVEREWLPFEDNRVVYALQKRASAPTVVVTEFERRTGVGPATI
jgi:hypothetical protein